MGLLGSVYHLSHRKVQGLLDQVLGIEASTGAINSIRCRLSDSLAALVEEAAAGQAFVICKAGKPMVRVTPLDDASSQPQPRRLGLLRGHCQVPDDFDQLGAAEIADLFEGR